MKTSRPVGVLGMTDEERAELRRTKKWPTRQVEAPEDPPTVSLSSLPSPEFLGGYLAALRPSSPKGQKPKFYKKIERTLECLKEAGGRTEDARKLYVKHSTMVDNSTASRQFSQALKTIQAFLSGD
jgi:hypothetical protein